MDKITPENFWSVILAVASAIVLLANAGEKIVKAAKVAKAPNQAQNERLDRLEDRLEVFAVITREKARVKTLMA